MALYTVSSAITKVKILIEEANDTNVVTQDELIELASEAQKWVAAESGCYQAWDAVTLLANTIRYTPPTGANSILTVDYNYGGDIGFRTLQEVDPNAVPHPGDVSKPYFWYYRGEKLCIYPAMPSVPSVSSVNVLITKIPASLTALTDSLVIPDDYQIVVPYHMAKEVAIKDNQPAKIAILNQEIMRYTKEGIASYAKKGTVGLSATGPVGTPGGAV